MTAGRERPADSARVDDGTLVDLRCSVAVVGNDKFLLVHRQATDDWVLPGGRPRDGESMVACARREVREETGLAVTPTRCAFVLEVISPRDQRRVVELVFLADGRGLDRRAAGEPGSVPEWVALERLPQLKLRPPIAGYLPAIVRGNRGTAPYLGNLWRPDEETQWPEEFWDAKE